MNHGNNPNDDINLDLSLRIGRREEDPMEEQGPFMELLRSENNSPSHSLQPSPPTNPYDFTLSLFPIPPVENSSLPALSPSPQHNQVFPSMQPEALEIPSNCPRLGRPPVENNSSEALFETPSTRLTLSGPPVESGSFAALSLYQQFYHPGALDTPSIRPKLGHQPPVENGSFTALSLYQQFYHPGALDTPRTRPRLGQPPVENGSFNQLYPPIQPEALGTPSTRPRLGRPPVKHRGRFNSTEAVVGNENLNDEEIVQAYPWTTTKPAMVRNLRYLTSNNINMIKGHIYCKPCNKTITLEYNLTEKFAELSRYIDDKEGELRQRAPDIWMNPQLTPCTSCQSGMKPFPSVNMDQINWLFLFLGQMLGCCNLEQLRYFCDKTKQHQTGAKNRVLYQTYLSIYKQLKSD